MPAPPYPTEVVASHQYINQTADLFVANVFTPALTSSYRVSVYARMQTTTPPGNTGIAIGWNDEIGGPLALSSATDQFGLGATAVGTFYIPFGNAINLSVFRPSGYSGMFDVFLTVERL